MVEEGMAGGRGVGGKTPWLESRRPEGIRIDQEMSKLSKHR